MTKITSELPSWVCRPLEALWTERGVHYLNVVVHIVACVQMTLTALEAREMSLGNLLEIYNHDKLDLYCCDLMLIVDDFACDRGGELGNLVQPQSGHGIGWHTPIASGRQRHGTHLGAVWQARALKLLVDKPATERAKPMKDYLVGIVTLALIGGYAVAKRLLGKHEYLSWAEAIAKEMIEEEIMKLICPQGLRSSAECCPHRRQV